MCTGGMCSQAGFPSTVHSVLRTALKLKLPAPVGSSDKFVSASYKGKSPAVVAANGRNGNLSPRVADVAVAPPPATTRRSHCRAHDRFPVTPLPICQCAELETMVASAAGIQSSLCPLCGDLMAPTLPHTARAAASPLPASSSLPPSTASVSTMAAAPPRAPAAVPFSAAVCPGCRRLLQECDPEVGSTVVAGVVDGGGDVDGGLPLPVVRQARRVLKDSFREFLIDSDDD